MSHSDLVAKVKAAAPAGVPVVAVLVHGGAFCFDNATLANLDAILDSWYPGASRPVASVLLLLRVRAVVATSSSTPFRCLRENPPGCRRIRVMCMQLLSSGVALWL